MSNRLVQSIEAAGGVTLSFLANQADHELLALQAGFGPPLHEPNHETVAHHTLQQIGKMGQAIVEHAHHA